MTCYPVCDWSPCGRRARFRDPGLGVNWCGQERCEEMILYCRDNCISGALAYRHLTPKARFELQSRVIPRWRRITLLRLLQRAVVLSLRFLAEVFRQLFLLAARIAAGGWWRAYESLDYEVTLADRKG